MRGISPGRRDAERNSSSAWNADLGPKTKPKGDLAGGIGDFSNDVELLAWSDPNPHPKSPPKAWSDPNPHPQSPFPPFRPACGHPWDTARRTRGCAARYGRRGCLHKTVSQPSWPSVGAPRPSDRLTIVGQPRCALHMSAGLPETGVETAPLRPVFRIPNAKNTALYVWKTEKYRLLACTNYPRTWPLERRRIVGTGCSCVLRHLETRRRSAR